MNESANIASPQADEALRLLTIPMAARLLSKSRWTVYRLVRDRQLPAVTVGGTLRVPAQAIQRLVDSAMDAVA